VYYNLRRASDTNGLLETTSRKRSNGDGCNIDRSFGTYKNLKITLETEISDLRISAE
jgi:hypothetical protein